MISFKNNLFPIFPTFLINVIQFNLNTGDNHMKRARQINFDTQGDVYVRACLTADRFHLTLKKQL